MINIAVLIASVVYYTYTYRNIGKCQGELCRSGTNGFINFWLRFFDTRRETQFLKVFRNHTMLIPSWRAAHLAMFKISVGRDPKNPTQSSMVKIQLSSLCPNIRNSVLCLNDRELICLPAWSNVNLQLTLFQNPQILRTISSGHEVIHTPAPYPVWEFIITMVIARA